MRWGDYESRRKFRGYVSFLYTLKVQDVLRWLFKRNPLIFPFGSDSDNLRMILGTFPELSEIETSILWCTWKFPQKNRDSRFDRVVVLFLSESQGSKYEIVIAMQKSDG